MSFGFGISDFIAVTELAWKVAEKCRSAPDDYAELTVSVQVIATVLDETTSFVRQGNVPGDCLKREALATARESCRVTLAEVQAFLDKHTGVEKGKRFFDIVRFIRHDIKALALKLRSSGDLLQLCHTALSGLSILKVQEQLGQIMSEYKNGIRERTIISDALHDNRIAPESELFNQLVVDLEDKDVHPDAISLNSAFIQSWLKTVIGTGQLLENDGPEPPQPPNDLASSDPLLPAEEDRTESASQIPNISDREPEHSMPPIHVLDIGDVVSVSRPASMSSHRSKPENWHPSAEPEPEFVQKMLEPIFFGLIRDGFPEPGSPEAQAFHNRFKRAYHQLDYTDRGFVTKVDVTNACEEALRRAGIPFDLGKLAKLVSTTDDNRDNRFDLGEFIQLMENMFFQAADSMRGHLEKQISAYCKQVEKGWSHPIAKEPIPWPFVLENESGKTYQNTILNVSVPSHPRLHQTSFSIMVFDAKACRAKLDRLEVKWQPIIPRSLQSGFLSVFETLRNIALRYSLFENPMPGAQCSDIDDGITYIGINGLFDPMDSFQRGRSTLNSIRDSSYQDLLRVQGVVDCLESIDSDLGPVIYTHQFQQLNNAWQTRHVNDLVVVINGTLSNWDEIAKRVDSFRQVPRTTRQRTEQKSVSFILRSLGYIPWTIRLKSATLLAEPEKKKYNFGFSKSNRKFFLVVQVGTATPSTQSLQEKDAIGKDFIFEEYQSLSPDTVLNIKLYLPDNSSLQSSVTAGSFLPFLARDLGMYSTVIADGTQHIVRLNYSSSKGESSLARECDDLLDACGPFHPAREAGDRLDEARLRLIGESPLNGWRQGFTGGSTLNILPPSWTIEEDRMGRKVYLHSKTQERTLVRPKFE